MVLCYCPKGFTKKWPNLADITLCDTSTARTARLLIISRQVFREVCMSQKLHISSNCKIMSFYC